MSAQPNFDPTPDPIPSVVARAEMMTALEPLCELLCIDVQTVLADPPMVISTDEVTFAVLATKDQVDASRHEISEVDGVYAIHIKVAVN